MQTVVFVTQQVDRGTRRSRRRCRRSARSRSSSTRSSCSRTAPSRECSRRMPPNRRCCWLSCVLLWRGFPRAAPRHAARSSGWTCSRRSVADAMTGPSSTSRGCGVEGADTDVARNGGGPHPRRRRDRAHPAGRAHPALAPARTALLTDRLGRGTTPLHEHVDGRLDLPGGLTDRAHYRILLGAMLRAWDAVERTLATSGAIPALGLEAIRRADALRADLAALGGTPDAPGPRARRDGPGRGHRDDLRAGGLGPGRPADRPARGAPPGVGSRRGHRLLPRARPAHRPPLGRRPGAHRRLGPAAAPAPRSTAPCGPPSSRSPSSAARWPARSRARPPPPFPYAAARMVRPD